MEVLVWLIIVSVAIEGLTSIVLYEDSLFHKMIWLKIQVALVRYPLLHKFSKCNYCISFWFSVLVCPFTFGWTVLLPIHILATWRLSHLFDALYRYYLIRSFVAGNLDIEE